MLGHKAPKTRRLPNIIGAEADQLAQKMARIRPQSVYCHRQRLEKKTKMAKMRKCDKLRKAQRLKEAKEAAARIRELERSFCDDDIGMCICVSIPLTAWNVSRFVRFSSEFQLGVSTI